MIYEMTKKSQDGKPERLQSLDTLRGFDMLWIIGGGALIGELSKATGWGWLKVLELQMHHVPWEGFRFEDLIFPLFMCVSGVAIPFALVSKVEKGADKRQILRKIFKRMVLLVLFGFIYNRALRDGFVNMRYASVLSQIGIAYFFAALILIYTRKTSVRIMWTIGILALVAIAQFLIPVPGFGKGVFTPEGAVNAWIDQMLLPGKLIYGTYDPEGVLCIVSATTVTLTGAFAGLILRNKELTQISKTIYLTITGVALVLIALVLSPVYPIIKNIWTVPFNLLTAGISFLLLALFYYIIDVRGWKSWTFFFKVIGLNSITIYLGVEIVDFFHSSRFLLGWLANWTGAYGEAVIVIGVIALEWMLLYYLYRNKIFLRV